MVPVGLVVASVGYLLAGWLRTRAVTGILIAFVLASFVRHAAGAALPLAAALLQLSIFEQYGAPLVDGLHPAAHTRPAGRGGRGARRGDDALRPQRHRVIGRPERAPGLRQVTE